MPKETFLNLTEEKRNKIIEAAIEEFENNTFDQASINSIVDKSGISKGSFYQYFSDKKDLYKYIISMMATKKMEYITPALANPFEHDFFKVLEDTFRVGFQFARDYPSYLKISNKLMKDKSHPIFIEIMKENSEMAISVYKMLLQKAVDKGEIREDVDLELAARLILNALTELINYYEDLDVMKWEEEVMKGQMNLLDIFAKGIIKRGNHFD